MLWRRIYMEGRWSPGLLRWNPSKEKPKKIEAGFLTGPPKMGRVGVKFEVRADTCLYYRGAGLESQTFRPGGDRQPPPTARHAPAAAPMPPARSAGRTASPAGTSTARAAGKNPNI